MAATDFRVIFTNANLRTWQQATSADTDAATFQVSGGYGVVLRATTGGTPPADPAAGAEPIGLHYGLGEGEVKLVLADAFLSVSAPKRLWVWAALPTVIEGFHA